jgi:hypothetical protein
MKSRRRVVTEIPNLNIGYSRDKGEAVSNTTRSRCSKESGWLVCTDLKLFKFHSIPEIHPTAKSETSIT